MSPEKQALKSKVETLRLELDRRRARLLAGLFECKPGAFGRRLERARGTVALGAEQQRLFSLEGELSRPVGSGQ